MLPTTAIIVYTIESRQLTDRELDEFEAIIRIACELRSDEKIGRKVKLPPDNVATLVPDHFRAIDGSLVVSFDAGWNLFSVSRRAGILDSNAGTFR